MKAVVCEQFGTADKLVFKDVEAPTAGVNQVLIDIKAAGCNNPDALLIEGKYQIKVNPPFIPGGEGAGIITAIGEGVNPNEYRIGDRVLFYSLSGTFADTTAVPAINIVRIPDEMPFDIAAGFMAGFGTAYHAFKQRGNIQPGEHVLILGAAGGVGSSAIQVAKAFGAQVIACVSTEVDAEHCKAIGADVIFNHNTQDLKTVLKEQTGSPNVDIILDTLGGDFSEMAFRCMAPNGRHLVIGFVSGIPKMPLNLPLVKEASIIGVFWNSWIFRNHKEHLENMNGLFQLYLDAKVNTSIGKSYPLAEYLEAFNVIAVRAVTGKVVLIP